MTRFSLLILVCLLFLPLAAARAQGDIHVCTVNHNAPPATAYSWPVDAHVRVYFVRNMFTAEQKATMLAAMDAWTVAAINAGSGVRFSYAGEIDDLISCSGCLTVRRHEVHKFNRKAYALFYPLWVDKFGKLLAAWIDFDFATKSPQALQGFMAHELGHGMGLGDCTGCKKKQTIMKGFPGINRDNGLIKPSVCDRETVRKVYEGSRRLAGNHMNQKAGSSSQ